MSFTKEEKIQKANQMRENPTASEAAFAKRLTELNIPFKQQVVIGFFIVDFLVGRHIIEIDGLCHKDKKEYDFKRTEYLKKKKYSVTRIKNENVLTHNISFLNKYIKIESILKIPKGAGLTRKQKK